MGRCVTGYIHGVACISTSFLFMAEQYSIVCKDHILIIHSLAEGHTFGCFHFWAIMSNAAVNTHLQGFVLGLFLNNNIYWALNGFTQVVSLGNPMTSIEQMRHKIITFSCPRSHGDKWSPLPYHTDAEMRLILMPPAIKAFYSHGSNI